ncbi:AAA family ATPase [Nonomuraea typhae]|uniref:AAA family ATPase n=1 Tax=Nonomuraea typhae TaxID=2603600 RepID=A0ABW7ZCD7_9ACTN
MLSEPLIGRLREQEQLTLIRAQSAAGRCRVVIVGGEAGVGKSTLVEHAAAAAERDGALVLAGGCVPSGADGPPLVPIVSALRMLVERAGPLTRAEYGLAVLMPELGGAHAGVELGQSQLFRLIGGLLARVSAERPLVLVVEDLHWADQSTLALLDVLARGMRSARLLVLATYRTDEPPSSSSGRPFLAELRRLGNTTFIDLDRFSREETAQFVTARSPDRADERLVRSVFERSGGNPFFAGELLLAERMGHAGLGRPLRELLLGRVDRLPEAAKHVVRTVAAGDGRISHALLAAAAGLDEEELLSGMRAAVTGQVLVTGRAGYDFAHALLREAVLEALLPGEVVRLHRAYAGALERQPYLVCPGVYPSLLAHHWMNAAAPDRALPALLRAAKAASVMHAPTERLCKLAHALAVWPQVAEPEITLLDLLTEAADTAWLAGEPEQALEWIDRALAEPALEPRRRALLLARRGRCLLHLGAEGDLAALEEAERLVGPAPSTERATVLDILALALAKHDDAPRAAEVCARAAGIAEESGDLALLGSIRTTLARTLSYLHRFDEALGQLDLVLDATGANPDTLARAQLNRTAILWSLGRYEEAARAARAGWELARLTGLNRTIGSHLAAFLGMALFATGRWPEAEAELRGAVEVDPPGLFRILPHVVLGELALARGDITGAEERLAAASPDLAEGERPAQGGDLALARLMAEIALAANRPDEAARAVAGLGDRAWTPPEYDAAWSLLAVAARVPGGSGAALRETAARLGRVTRPWAACGLQVEAELGRADLWPRIVDAWDALGHPFHGARARLRAAGAALAAGDRAAAGVFLREAVRQAAELGASPLHGELSALARGARLPLDPPAPATAAAPYPMGLTRREWEVLRLITEGRSNREIAAELVISEKTVSVHVSRTLAKLGAPSRGQAAATAHRLRLFE